MPRPATTWRTAAFFFGPPLLFVSTLLAIALLFFYALVFLEFIPALLFLLGLALTLAGTQPWWLKAVGILGPVGLPALGLYVFFQGWLLPSRSEHALILLPVTLRGEVDIVQNEVCGAALARPAGQLTIPIPASGLVVTSSPVTEDLLAAATYCRVDAHGRRLDTLRRVEEGYGGLYVQTATGPQLVRPPELGVLLLGTDAVAPANWQGLPPDEDHPDPSGPVMEPVRYVSFLVTRPDSLASPPQGPAFRQKLRLRVGIPAGCDRLRAPMGE